MFILIDVRSFQEQLDYNEPMTCSHCGRFGRYEAFVSGSRFRLFFIPLFTFGKQYLVHTTCCNSWARLNPEKGKAIEKNRPVHIEEEDLEWVDTGYSADLQCPNCGRPYEAGTNYCPSCGEPLR